MAGETALKVGGRIQEATFLQRLTRFSCLVSLQGRRIQVHFPNSGRHRELLVPGQKVLLREETKAGRKTDYDLIMVSHGPVLVSVDARVPNKLLGKALEEHTLAEFTEYDRIFREVRRGQSRLDFRLENAGPLHYVEVKSVTLIRRGQALFPDAPTSRGRRHLKELMAIASGRARATIVFVIQREDADSFGPNDEADPEYGRLLRHAAGNGVRILAYRCQVTPQQMQIETAVPVELP